MPAITPIDALDILLVAYFLFRLMMLIRGTRATAIIKGLAVLFVANLASGWLGLRTVNWILEQGTTVILVALPVVFFPELRRALEHLGRGQLFSRLAGMGPEEVGQVVDPVARSARLLSESRTGALIVIEREVGLEEYVESGVRMDAAITTELLLNIFTPNTPLHDGAVIIPRPAGGRSRLLPSPDGQSLHQLQDGHSPQGGAWRLRTVGCPGGDRLRGDGDDLVCQGRAPGEKS